MESNSIIDRFITKLRATQGLGQVIIGLTVALATGLFFVTSYKFEVNYLTGLGVPLAVSNQLATVDISTYSSLVQGLTFVSLIATGSLSIFVVSNGLRRIVSSKFFFFVLSLFILALVSIKYFLYPQIGIEDNSALYLITSSVISFLFIPALINLAITNLHLDTIYKLSIFKDKLFALVLLSGAFYWSTYTLFTISGNIAQIQSIQSPLKVEIVIEDKSYQLIRRYDNYSILKKENSIYTLDSADSHPVLYKQSL